MRRHDAEHGRASSHDGLRLASAVVAFVVLSLPGIERQPAWRMIRRARDPDPIQEFRKEYPQHCAKLIECYNNLLIEGKTTRFLPKNAANLREVAEKAKAGERVDIPVNEDITEWEIRGAQGSLSYERRVRNGQITIVDVVAPKMSFKVEKRADTKSFVVQKLWDDQSNDMEVLRHDIWEMCPGVSLPYALAGTPISSLLKDKMYKFSVPKPADAGDRNHVQVDWVKTSADGGNMRMGYFRFAKNKSYVLTEYEHRFNLGPDDIAAGRPKLTSHWTLEYTEKVGEVPLLKKIDVWRTTPQGVQFHERMIEILRIERAKIPESDFTFERFGLRTS